MCGLAKSPTKTRLAEKQPDLVVSKRNATLVHNEKAGDKRHDRAALVQLLERGGYTVSYFAAKECDLAEALGQPAEIIVSAAGDGMVARLVAHARSDGPPIAILPLGTAKHRQLARD